MNGRVYGPTAKGKTYLAVSYHQRTARKRKDKSRWVIDEPSQFAVFGQSDAESLHFPHGQVLVGLSTNCQTKLGCDDERLAKFLAPSEGANDWHGFPVFSAEFDFSEDFLDLLEGKKIIDRTTRIRLAKSKL